MKQFHSNGNRVDNIVSSFGEGLGGAMSGKAIKVCKRINPTNELHSLCTLTLLSLNDGSEMERAAFFC